MMTDVDSIASIEINPTTIDVNITRSAWQSGARREAPGAASPTGSGKSI